MGGAGMAGTGMSVGEGCGVHAAQFVLEGLVLPLASLQLAVVGDWIELAHGVEGIDDEPRRAFTWTIDRPLNGLFVLDRPYVRC